VTLPDRVGGAVEVPIDHQLGPDEADRFAFRLKAEGGEGRHVGQDLFFELDVSVRHDNDPKPLRVGRVLVALPGTPQADDASIFAVPGTCTRIPPKAQLAATSFRGTHSPELDAFLRALRTAGGRTVAAVRYGA
jgi:hypothetical protein